MKIFLMIVALVATTFTANAGIKDDFAILRGQEFHPVRATSVIETAMPTSLELMGLIGSNIVKGYDETLGNYKSGGNGVVVANIINGVGSYGFTAKVGNDIGGESQTPIAYEPYSKTLYALSCGMFSVQGRPDSLSKITQLTYSYDLGKTWSLVQLDSAFESIDPRLQAVSDWYYPSIAVSNPSKSSNPDSVKIAYRMYRAGTSIPGLDRYDILTSVLGFTSGTRMKSTNKDDRRTREDVDIPWDGSNKFQKGVRSYSSMVGDSSYAFYFGVAIPTEGSAEKYHYGLVGLTYNNASTATANEIVNDNKANVAREIREVEKYFNAEAGYNSSLGLDCDSVGNVYLINVNLSPDFDNTNKTQAEQKKRVPRVFKSSINNMDNEDAFVLTDSVPDDVIKNYIAGNDGVLDSAWIWSPATDIYSNASFVVTADGEYSFVASLYYYYINSSSVQTVRYDFVEVAKQNNAWTIRNIHTRQSDFGGYVTDETTSGARRAILAPFSCKIDTVSSGTEKGNYKVWLSRRDNEIELSKTADGKYLVAKFVVCDSVSTTDNTIAILPNEMDLYFTVAYTNVNGQTMSDTCIARTSTFYSTKTVVAYRKIDGGTWSKPVNAIKSDTMNTRNTTMPRIVPDTNNIPVFFSLTRMSTADTTNADKYTKFLYSLPRVLSGSCIDAGMQIGYMMMADATMNNQWDVLSITKVGESSTFSLEAAYPNPTNSSANFRFSLNRAAHTTLTLNNTLGQPIAVLVDEYLDTNQYLIDFNVEALPAGTYYYTLKSGTQSETKMINVIK